MYGYFYINLYKNPNKEVSNKYRCYNYINRCKYALQRFDELDWILYDFDNKPSNQVFKSYLDMILSYIKEDNTLVILSLFQLGRTKVDIYRVLSMLKEKRVNLVVRRWNIDISITMKKVLELSIDDLAVYEHINLISKGCYMYENESNLYGKLAGYKFNEEYIERLVSSLRRKKSRLL